VSEALRLRASATGPAAGVLPRLRATTFAAVLACCSASGCSILPIGTVPAADVAAADPLNAAYVVDDQVLRLRAGRHEAQAAPDSAAMRTTTVFGKPTFGDLDDDGRPDAALLLVQQSGGSGSFFSVAAALNRSDGYHGTNAVLLGDRIAPQGVAIRHGVVMANYADRRADEPMAARPSIGKTAYLTVINGQLSAIAPLGYGEQVLAGWLTVGQNAAGEPLGTVLVFRPCARSTNAWLSDDSPALSDITAAYRAAAPNAPPETRLFAVLAGVWIDPPREGPGARYDAAFRATHLVRATARGTCGE
jgi:hypothetical protein